MITIWNEINSALETDQQAQNLTLMAIILRAGVMFFAVLILLRVSNKRFLARRNALDTLLGLLLASMLARAINGSEPFFETIAAGFFIVFCHRILTWTAFRSHRLGTFLKGKPETVIDGGQPQLRTLACLHISEHDLKEDLRLQTGSDNLRRLSASGRAQRRD